MTTSGHIQNFFSLLLSVIIDIFVLSQIGKTKDGNFTTVLLNKWQNAPTLNDFFFLFFPLHLILQLSLKHCRVTAWWEHNRSKAQELWNKVNFTEVFCGNSWSHWTVKVTNFSVGIIILELPLYYKLYHIDISTNESPQKQKKLKGKTIFRSKMRKKNLISSPRQLPSLSDFISPFQLIHTFPDKKFISFAFLRMLSSLLFHMTSQFHLSLVISECVWTVSHTRRAAFCSLIFL